MFLLHKNAPRGCGRIYFLKQVQYVLQRKKQNLSRIKTKFYIKSLKKSPTSQLKIFARATSSLTLMFMRLVSILA